MRSVSLFLVAVCLVAVGVCGASLKEKMEKQGVLDAAPATCQVFHNRHKQPSYTGTCLAPNTCTNGQTLAGHCAGSSICCIKTFPNEAPVLPQVHITTNHPVVTHLVRTAKSSCMDTDGVRPPYVSLSDDHQSQTALPGLDASIHPYVVIPCNNPDKIPYGNKVTITNTKTGKSVEGIAGDCGDGNCDRSTGYGEMSYAATRAIGTYIGPEKTNNDPVTLTFHN